VAFAPRTDDLLTLIRIAALGSFFAVARERGVTASQVTRAIDGLELGCNVRLMHRTRTGEVVTVEGRGRLAIAPVRVRVVVERVAQCNAEQVPLRGRACNAVLHEGFRRASGLRAHGFP
jgi:DNA-binding transcriptional LysR family regulator